VTVPPKDGCFLIKLPNEIICNIIGFLNSDATAACLGVTCKALYQLFKRCLSCPGPVSLSDPNCRPGCRYFEDESSCTQDEAETLSLFHAGCPALFESLWDWIPEYLEFDDGQMKFFYPHTLIAPSGSETDGKTNYNGIKISSHSQIVHPTSTMTNSKAGEALDGTKIILLRQKWKSLTSARRKTHDEYLPSLSDLPAPQTPQRGHHPNIQPTRQPCCSRMSRSHLQSALSILSKLLKQALLTL